MEQTEVTINKQVLLKFNNKTYRAEAETAKADRKNIYSYVNFRIPLSVDTQENRKKSFNFLKRFTNLRNIRYIVTTKAMHFAIRSDKLSLFTDNETVLQAADIAAGYTPVTEEEDTGFFAMAE